MYSALEQITFRFADGNGWVGTPADFQRIYAHASPNGSRNTHFGTLYDHFHADCAQAPEPDPNSQPVDQTTPDEAPQDGPFGNPEAAGGGTVQGGNPDSPIGHVPNPTGDVENAVGPAADAPVP